MDQPYRTRTEVLFSADGKSATILRRGPKLHFHLIKWGLSDDTFQHGQWMKGTVALWDLNSAGDKLVYWARQWHRSAPQHYEDWEAVYRPYGLDDWPHVSVPEAQARKRGRLPRFNEGIWTAVSTPPNFSAFAIWPCAGHWTGGGWFEDDRTLILNETESGLRPKLNRALPPALVVGASTRQLGKEMPGLAARPAYRFVGADADLAAALQGRGVRWLDWIYRMPKGDVLFAADGCIFRARDGARKSAERVVQRAERLIDLRPLSFELVKPGRGAFDWPLRVSGPAPGKGARRRKPRRGSRRR